jgi:hypothetical protein
LLISLSSALLSFSPAANKANKQAAHTMLHHACCICSLSHPCRSSTSTISQQDLQLMVLLMQVRGS